MYTVTDSTEYVACDSIQDERNLEFRTYLTYTNQLLLIDRPITVFLIWITYMAFVIKIGPVLMKNRPPFKLHNIIKIYNIFQIGSCVYIMYNGFSIIWKEGFLPKCSYNRSDAVGYLSTIHFYFLIKVVELLDTVFFILRKKYDQASFLHIYHHSYMVLSVWATIKYDPSYCTLLPGALNSWIHMIMYTYYTLAMFPKLTKHLWWKKYITTLQLIQFLIITFHMLRSYHVSECPPSFILAYSMAANMFFFITLFSNFYIKCYRKPEKI